MKWLNRVGTGIRYMFDKKMHMMYDIELDLDEKTINAIRLNAMDTIITDDKELINYGIVKVLTDFVKSNRKED